MLEDIGETSSESCLYRGEALNAPFRISHMIPLDIDDLTMQSVVRQSKQLNAYLCSITNKSGIRFDLSVVNLSKWYSVCTCSNFQMTLLQLIIIIIITKNLYCAAKCSCKLSSARLSATVGLGTKQVCLQHTLYT